MNRLHQFLAAGFIKASPYLGEEITFHDLPYTAFTSAVDDRLLMEIVGYVDESDMIAVISRAQFVAAGDNPPAVKDQLVRDDGIYSVRGVKATKSSYLMALKRISETVPTVATGVGFSGGSFGSSSLGSTAFG